MNEDVNNIFNNIPDKISEELFSTLLVKGSIKIERIISQGQCSPLKDWYDQVQDEWILLIEGQAEIQFDNDSPVIILKAGDYLLIPAHSKHRLHWTHPEIKSIWLAIHIYPTEPE